MAASKIFKSVWPIGLTALALGSLGPGPVAAASSPSAARLVMRTGSVRLEPAVDGRWRLEVPAGAGARLMVGDALVVVAGHARLSGDAGRRPTISFLEGQRVALYGAGRLETPAGWRIDLRRGGLVLAGGTLHLLAGEAWVKAPRRPLLGQPRPLARARTAVFGRLIGPKRVMLGLDGQLSVLSWSPAAAGRLERLLLLAASATPPRWDPAVTEPSATQARRAVRLARKQRQAARETASCGCTEGQAGDSASGVGQGPVDQTLENRNGTIRVRVRGVPRGSKGGQ